MPRLGRQCSTTVSPGSIFETPGPISRTFAEASWPSKCGRNLSGPLAAAISFSCAPQIVVYSTLTRTCPTSSVSGSCISSTISGSRDLARIAALVFLTCIVRGSLEIDELIVAGIAEVIVEPDPLRSMQDGFRCQRPAFEVELFEFVSVPLDHNVFAFADPLDFLDRSFQFIQAQIMQSPKRYHQIKGLVAERVTVLGPIVE